MKTYDVHAVTTAAPAVVYRLLLDGATWPSWSKVDAYRWEPDATPSSSTTTGTAGLRVFRTGRNETRERITSTAPDRMMAYKIEQGHWLLRNYQGRIDLVAEGEGTRIRWRAQWGSPLPWLGFFMERFMRHFQQEMVNGLAQFAASPDPRS